MKKNNLSFPPFLFFIYTLAFFFLPSRAEETFSIDYVRWSELSQTEKQTLRARWTGDRVKEIVEALQNGKRLPDFVGRIPLNEEQVERIESLDMSFDSAKNYDLRGIPLGGQKLGNVNLPFVHLEGSVLSGANLEGSDLFEAFLEESDLSASQLPGADLSRAKLRGANLSGANLRGADLGGGDVRAADLTEANLQGTDLFEANLQESDLSYANLKEAMLSGANLQSADFFHAGFDWTYLWRANLGEGEDIRYIVWGGKPSYRITNESLQDLRSERFPKEIIEALKSLHDKEFKEQDAFLKALEQTIGKEETKSYKSLILSYSLATVESQSFYIGEEKSLIFPEDFQNAGITYRDLENIYRNASMDEIGDEFNFRENEVQTKGSPWPLRIFRILFFKWTYGYGSRPLWILWYSLSVVGVFTMIYVFLTMLPKARSGIYIVHLTEDEEEKRLSEERLSFRRGGIFLECFYFSLISFVTFGFDILQPKQWLEFFRLRPVKYIPIGWARIVVGLEAAFGIYIIALLLVAVLGLF